MRTESKNKAVHREQVAARASVSFDRADYAELERIAEEKRVSVAWVVRDAVSQYLRDRNPLFRTSEADRGRV